MGLVWELLAPGYGLLLTRYSVNTYSIWLSTLRSARCGLRSVPVIVFVPGERESYIRYSVNITSIHKTSLCRLEAVENRNEGALILFFVVAFVWLFIHPIEPLWGEVINIAVKSQVCCCVCFATHVWFLKLGLVISWFQWILVITFIYYLYLRVKRV